MISCSTPPYPPCVCTPPILQQRGRGSRRASAVGFRGWVKANAEEETTADGHPVFTAEAGRYHLVVSAACPFCHRTTILRALKGLEVPLRHDAAKHNI